MARSSFLRRAPKSQDMGLQITSMADIFTILLIFLLKSYSVGALETTAPKGLQLPQANAGTSSLKTVNDIMKVEVTQDEVLVNGKSAVKMQQFAFAASDIDGEGASKTLVSGVTQATQANAKVLVVADQRAPYETIKAVLASVAMRGYTDMKLAVSPVDGSDMPAQPKSAPAAGHPGKRASR